MTSIHSDKENDLSFCIPPKTPAAKSHNTNLRTPAQPILGIKSLNATAFVTPAPNRVPLGGKDTNVRARNEVSVAKKSGILSSQRRSAKATAEITYDKTATPYIEEPSVPNFEELEIETIPNKLPSLPDFPLDHIELDYEAMRKASTIVFDERQQAKFDDRLDGPSENLFGIDAFEVHDLELPSVVKAKGLNPSQKHLFNKRRTTKPSFMTPTFSTQAKKSGVDRQTSSQANKKLGNDIRRKITKRPDPIDLDVSIDELEVGLDLHDI